MLLVWGTSRYAASKPRLRMEEGARIAGCYSSIADLGDSHARHMVNILREVMGPSGKVTEVCKPGASLFNAVSTSAPPPVNHCYLIMAGSNYVAWNCADDIFRHVDPVLRHLSSNSRVVVATLPHRHDDGGVAIFVKQTTKFKKHSLNFSLQICIWSWRVWRRALLSWGAVVVVGLYRSSGGYSGPFFGVGETLSRFSIFLSTGLKHFIVLGDFNINVRQTNEPMTSVFKDTVGSFGVKWSVNSPTRVTAASGTAIDTVITNLTNT